MGVTVKANMKHKIGIAIILTLLFCVSPRETQAQFWKKWFKKEEPKRPARPKKPGPADNKQPTKPVTKKRPDKVEYPSTVVKARYRIDLLLPLYLNELVKNDKVVYKDKLPEKAISGVNFYEGVRMAADSLTKMGYAVDIHVHDITEPGLTPDAIIKKSTLDSSDLIIGGLQSSQLMPVAKYAEEKHINFVSAFSPSDGDVLNNPYFTILQPTLYTHCRRIRDVVLKKHAGKNTLLFYRTNPSVDSAAYSNIIWEHERDFKKLSINTLPQQKQLASLLDSTGTNVIIMPVLDHVYAESVITQLSDLFPNYSFEVYGMPSWKSITSVRKSEAYPNISVSFTQPFYYDISTAAGQTLSAGYKREFGGKVSEMVFRGYETLFWYVYLLKRYGTIYNPKQTDNGGSIFTRYEVKPQWNNKQELLYNENEHLYFYRYQSGSYTIEQ
jgi:hypothetical protein